MAAFVLDWQNSVRRCWFRLILHPSRACLAFHKAASLAHYCSPCTFLLSTMSFLHIASISTSTPTTHSFTWRSARPTTRRWKLHHNVSAMFRAGSWRTACYSIRIKRKQFCSEPARNGRRSTRQLELTSLVRNVAFSSSVKLLGVTLDEDLTLDRHVTEIIRGCSYHTRALRHIRPLIDLPTARMVAQGVVTSRLDYCNGLLYGTSTRNIDRLQVAQNTLARAVCQASWSSSATDLRRSLHWLPVKQRIDYKLAVVTFKAQSTGVPAYLASLVDNYVPTRTLRSADQFLLCSPIVKLVCSRKAFSVNAPLVFNSLPYNCRSAPFIIVF